MKSSGFPSKKNTTLANTVVNIIIQYLNLSSAILCINSGFLYTMVCKTKNNPIRNTPKRTFRFDKKPKIVVIWKSTRMYFCMAIKAESISCNLKGIHVRNTRYCIMKIPTILPNDVLKNFRCSSCGNLSTINLCITR